MNKIRNLGEFDLAFYCPGCKCSQRVTIKRNPEIPQGPLWTFNGDYEKPTIRASVLTQWNIKDKPHVCHSFITDGKIEFLNDCTHELAGQTVEMEDY